MHQYRKRKYLVGFLIGRFQPFHYGHVYLFQEAFEICEKLIVGIGSSNITDLNNPYSVSLRKEMIQAFLCTERFTDRVLKIVEIPDVPDDDEWLKICLENVPTFDVVIGDNEWVNGIFENAGYSVLRIGHYKRDLYEGQKIRALQREKKEWKDRVPKYIVDLIK